MAAQALIKIKEAEAKAGELVRNATSRAKEILSEAANTGESRYTAAITEAENRRRAMLADAEQRANTFCEALVKEAEADVARIMSPAADRFEKAVSLVTERVVNSHGHS